MNLQLKYLLKDDKQLYYIKSDMADPTLYFSFLPQFAQELQEKGKGIIFLGNSFAFGLLGKPEGFNIELLKEECKKQG